MFQWEDEYITINGFFYYFPKTDHFCHHRDIESRIMVPKEHIISFLKKEFQYTRFYFLIINGYGEPLFEEECCAKYAEDTFQHIQKLSFFKAS